MNSLLIIAHPNKQSFSHILAEDYASAQQKKWYTIRTIDLYDDERKQDYLKLNETNHYVDDPLRLHHQAQISRADEIVFFFPLWWFDAPAILKNRFDVNYTSGFAFRYKSKSVIPEKLLSWKKARVIVTAWGPWWLYKTIGWLVIVLPWMMGRIDYVGMKLSSWTWFTDMNRYKTVESRSWMREKIKRLAR